MIKPKQTGTVLIALLIILTSVSAILYSILTDINIERQAVANYQQQQTITNNSRNQLKIVFDELSTNNFEIINQLSQSETSSIPANEPNYSLSITKLSPDTLLVEIHFNNPLTGLSHQQQLKLLLSRDEASQPWQLLTSDWYQVNSDTF